MAAHDAGVKVAKSKIVPTKIFDMLGKEALFAVEKKNEKKNISALLVSSKYLIKVKPLSNLTLPS